MKISEVFSGVLGIVLFWGGSIFGCTNVYPPVADLECTPYHMFLGGSALMDANDSYDPDGSGGLNGSGIIKFEWDFTSDGTYDYSETADDYGDGAFDGKHSHIYDSTGIYCVTVRVTDSGEPARTSTAWDYVRVYDVICVDKNATGSGQGYNWANAFTTIAAGINASYSSNEIWVAEGTYTVTSAVNVNKAIKLYGGFDGETELSERDWRNHITTVQASGETIRCFYITKDATVDGFTATGGANCNGAGIRCNSCAPTIKNCVIKENHADHHYGMGGGIYTCDCSNVVIENCFFKSNSADYDGSGAGVMIHGETVLDGSATIRNCCFVGNSAEGGGGGARICNSTAIFVNCTFKDNSAAKGGAMYCSGLALWTHVRNCILWGNTAGLGRQFYVEVHHIDVSYNDIDDTGLWATEGTYGYVHWANGHNKFSDPKFVSSDVDGADNKFMTSDDGLRLSSANDSPCIDAGKNSYMTLSTDIAGQTRKVDDPDTTDTGDGTAPIVDMGAYEYQVP